MDISTLRTTFKGTVIASGDDQYDKARTVFYGGIDKKPAAIIRVADAEDVAKAIQFAKTFGLELAVRSGGHSFPGFCTTEGGIVIDMHDMRTLDIDVRTKTVWGETGLTAMEVTRELDKQNLALGFGDTGSVGIGGITLGGGVGFLVRKYGLTIDNLLAAEIATADGTVILVNEKQHPDLFWAIRGGGGNFGVVTRFQYQLHDLTDVIGGMLMLPATPEVIVGCIDIAQKAPDELSTIFNIMPAPPMPMIPKDAQGALAVMALVMYAGDPKLGEQVIAPIRNLAKPLADMVRPMRYKDIFFPEDESYHPLAVAKTMFMKNVDQSVAQTIVDHLNQSDAPMRAVQLRVLGGAASRVSADASAYAHRDSAIMTNIAAFYQGSEDKSKHQAWVDDVAQRLYQGDSGAYVGFIGPGEEVRIHDVYPEVTWKRLVEIKKRYDPTNLFKLNVNIQPADNNSTVA